MKYCLHVWVVFLVFLLDVESLGPYDDPYEILGVRKSATLQDIRKAYKRLAKEWHPDKNDDPKAANKFVEVTQAYELLTDPERRKLFDTYGHVNPDSNPRTKREYHFPDIYPFDDFFGFTFNAHDPDISLFHKMAITQRGLENNLLPKSFHTPHLLFFYSDWCFSCLKIEPIWRRMIEELEPIGIELATVHSENEPLLTKKLGVATLPSIVLLIDGKHYLYKESSISVQKIVDFIRSKFPYKFVTMITDSNIDEFLGGWLDNRVRGLICHKSDTLRLRYLVTAFFHRDRVSFGFVHLASDDTEGIRKRFKIPLDSETLLLFNENSQRPVASLSMPTISVPTMRNIIAANKYLILPRLSSQKMLDALCPVEWALQRKRLCIVLVSQSDSKHDELQQSMRMFAQNAPYNAQRVRFSYIYRERQPEFIEALSHSNSGETHLHNVVILWRRDATRIKYEWVPGKWESMQSLNWNESKQRLESVIGRLLKSDQGLTYEAVVNELIDEHAQSLFGKILTRLFIAFDIAKDWMKWDVLLVVGSVIATIVFIVGGGFLMSHLMKLEEEKVRLYQESKEPSENNNRTDSNGTYIPQLRVHELRAEKYNGMVRLLKPGCRTIVLLLDMQSKPILLPKFHKIVWPYRKNKTLMFGFICIERGLEWYKRLLTLSLPEPRQLNINPRNCIGTVLCLNGHRKYFCMYHAKYPESINTKGSKRMMRMTKTLSVNSRKNDRAGGFMGFNDSSDSESDCEIVDVEIGVKPKKDIQLEGNEKSDNVIYQDNLLDGLPNWLDRLFEGSTHRYYINYWPDFPTK